MNGVVYKRTWQGAAAAVKESRGTDESATFVRGMIFGAMGISAMVAHHDIDDIWEGEELVGYCGVMEYIDGKPLYEILEDPLAEWERKQLALSMLKGYRSIVERSVLPGDLHCGNLLVTSDREIKFIDFDHYALLGEPEVRVATSIREFAQVARTILPQLDCTAAAQLLTQLPTELTEEVFEKLLPVVDSLIAQVEQMA